METIKMKWTGIRPLLMSNGLMMDPLNEYVKRCKEITNKRKKTETDYELLYRLRWEGSLYFDEESGPFMPNDNIEACIKFGARKLKLGKDVEAAVLVTNEIVPLNYSGPRTLEALWVASTFQLKKPTKLGVMSIRPMFPTGWSCEFELEYDDEIIDRKNIVLVQDIAGRQIGCGAWHPKFGRFLSEVL